MISLSFLAPKPPRQALPLEIYISTVDALYADARSLFAGSVSSAIAALVTFLKTGDWTLLTCAVALVAVGIARGGDMRSYARQKQKPSSAEEARRWELRYIYGSAIHVTLLGVWCFLAFARTSDAVVHLISFSVILAYLVGITGRNFSSDQLVVVQTACAAPPMIFGLLVQGDPYHAFLAVLLIPFFLSIRFISARLRGILFNAVIATQDVKSLAARFDTALNNMPHGLCMFDEGQRMVVANSRFNQLLGLSSDIDRRGLLAQDLLEEFARSGMVLPAQADRFVARFTSTLSASRRRTLSIGVQEGKTLDIIFQPMGNGGCVVIVEDITERRRAEAKIEHLARFDALTGLPNRTSFTAKFERSLASGKAGVSRAVLFVDLDEFKQVNDTLGHPCGDALLCQVADRLRDTVRSADLVARFGGDEFVVLQTTRSGRQSVAALAERIIETLSQIYTVEGHQIAIGASIGIAMAPEDGTTADQLLKCADIALYRAKGDGRGGYCFFESDMDVKAQARRKLELDIRDAVANCGFEIHYQPVIDLKTKRASGCEALLRWRHPERGMISPGEFIPVAEEMGLIVEIGSWVLREACLECARWPEDVRLAVNLSSIQFRRTSVDDVVRDALTFSGLSPDRLELEITETVLLQDTSSILATLRRLRDMGVRIALDDFGTGYSSLSYLHAFPLNKVKIDRSFLMGIESDSRVGTLVRGIARLSAELGMSVVMEGVETQQQLKLISAEKNISHVQGYLFAAPMTAAKIRQYLGSERENATRVA